MSLNNRISLSIALFLVLSLLFCSTTTKEVDSFNLLLPTSYHAAKGHARQIVITSGECYDWESTDANIIKVQGTHHGLVPSETASKSSSCNSNGIVELIHKGAYPSSVYITARDRLSSELISIPVRIRDLKRISIVTKSKIMNIREIQNLEIRGFDSENNTFTSIEGLRFTWTITEISDESHSKGSIEKIPLRESSLYMPLDTRKKLEIEEGAESDLLIIRANQVGKVSVKARCIESNYELISDEIILYIQEKFELSPGLPVHLLAGSTFQYNLLTPSGLNKTLPQSFYKIELSNPNFQSSSTLLVKTPRNSEESTLTILDTRTSPAFSQSATIYSHQPDSIEILMAENIIVGEIIRYDIKFYHNQKLLKGSIDPSLLNIGISEVPYSNGDRVFLLDRTSQRIEGFNKGSGIFKVEYNGLKAEKPIKSITPLKLVSQSQRVVLPVGEIYQLNIVGGSGVYKYSHPSSSNEHELITVAFNGMITTKKEGNAIIVVTDEKNANNRLQIKIVILKFGDIQSIEKYKEFNLNEEGSLFIAGSPRTYSESLESNGAKTIQHFTECNDALLRGLTLSPLSRSEGKVLEIINVNPVNYQTLNELLAYSETNKNINKLLQSRTTVIKEDIFNEFKVYLKAGELKESELERIILDMENYGLCAKVVVKPVSVYDGEILISKAAQEEANPSKSSLHMNLRVYEPLKNNILGFVNENNDEIFVAPLGSFKWNTIGGPKSWNVPAIGELEVSINGIKLDPSKSNKVDYLYPTITCPGTEKSETTYTLKYSNPESQYLLRPVSQTQQITLQCQVPELLRIGLPKKHTQLSKTNSDNTYDYVLSEHKNSTVYILPGNCFRISVEGVYGNSRMGVREFYNVSNLDIEFQGHLYGNVEEIASDTAKNPHSWNTRTIKYDPKSRKTSEKYLPDTLTITSRQLLSSKNSPFKLPYTLTHEVTIQTLEPLSILSAPSEIILPSHPESSYTLKLGNITDSNRFSYICDENVLKCRREGRDSIIITPQNLGKSTTGTITIVDEYALGNPTIVVPVKVQVIDGIDLRVTRNTKKHWGSNIEKEKSELPVDAWIFGGEEFTAYVDVYSYNSSVGGKSPKQSIRNLNPSIIELNFPSFESHKIVEISREYNPTTELVTIVYSLARTSHSQSRDPSSFKFTAIIRPLSGKSLVSNTVSVRVYDSIALLGSSINLPVEQLSIGNKGRTFVKEVQSYANIMESCSTILEVQGGPPELVTKLLVTNGQGHYYNIVKINERRFRIETIQPTSNKDNKGLSDTNFAISGNENNLISLQVNTQTGEELAIIKCLIFVSALKSFHIEGNSMLLAGKDVRYLAQFTESETNNNNIPILKNECSLKYKWSFDTKSANSLLIVSDPTKMGVNITGLPTAGVAELIVTIFNQYSKEVSRATKKISVVNDDDVHINGVTIGSDEILLLPPYSSLNLGDVVVEEVSPCDRDNSQVNIVGNNQVVTRSSSQSPELLRLQQKSHHNTNLPQYVNIQVAEICTASLQNIDGSINVSPSAAGNSVNEGQLIRFYIMDCYGRKFKYYDFKDVEYKIYVNDPNIGTARVVSREKGLVSIQGHEIGQSQVVFEVISGGSVKARDVVPIVVNVFIHPSRPLSLHVGDIVHFKAPATLSAVEKWSSGDSSIVKINSNSGEAVAYSEGETYVKLGAMSTRLSVIKLADIVQKHQNNENRGYEYELVYSGKVYPTVQQDSQYVKKLLNFRCEVLGKEGQFLRGSVGTHIIRDEKEFIQCIVEKIPGTATLQTPVKNLKFRIIAENQNTGFYLQKEFEESLEIFMILSERHINPKDPKFRKDKSSYLLVIQTTERLDFHQTGGKDSWITNSEFNGARQIISLDLSHYRSGEWVIHVQNPRTRQADSIIISSSSHDTHSQQKPISSEENSGWWNWTDLLVLFMAVNFLAILGYQILQRKSGGSTHAKIY